MLIQSTVASGVTSEAFIYNSQPSTTAAIFTLPALYHYTAQGTTVGATSTLNSQAGFYAHANLTTAGSNYGFFGNITAGTNRWNLFMNGTANNYMAGSLGIGTTSPSLPLHVYNSAAALAYFESTNANGAYAIWRNSGTNFGDVGSALGISGSGSASDFMVASRAGSMILGTSSAERMRITTAGNVGIGTTSPVFTLDVSGNIRSNNTIFTSSNTTESSFQTNSLTLGYSSTNGYGWITSAAASRNILALQGGGGTVTIGATTDNSTTAKLQVTGGISYQNIFNRQTASYTLVLTDQSKIIEMNVATANNLTVPLNSSVAFPIGTEIQVLQYGAGQTTIVATGGVTLRSNTSWLKIGAQYTGVTLVKVGTDEWYVIGNVAA